MTEQPQDTDLLESAPRDEYEGWALVSTGSAGGEDTTGGDSVVVEASLRGHFEPLDGRFHWYGRIAANDALAARVRSGETVLLTTRRGSAEGRVSDVDPWGRFRIAGTGRPPFQ